VRRGQLRRRRRGLEHQMGAPEPDHARLLDEFFGPEQPSRHPAGPGKLAGPRAKAGRVEQKPTRARSRSRPNGRAVTLSRSMSRSGRPTSAAQARRAKQKTTTGWSCPYRNRSSTTLSRCTSRPGGRLAWTTIGSSRFRPARGADGSCTCGVGGQAAAAAAAASG
jgi:hypothetical protein